jgi:transposase
MESTTPTPEADPPALFPLPAAAARPEPEPPAGRPRLEQANRAQLEWRTVALDSLLPEEHRARAVWQYVEGLDLAPLYAAIRATEVHPGRPAIDPRLLLALWLYATTEGVGSARALARLCEEHLAYQWLCGGVSVNYHTLADFRTAHVEVLDTLLTHSVATLMAAGVVTLTRVAVDGMRVRASAGAGSFRRRGTLQRCLAEAQAHVQALRTEVQTDPAATTQRQRAARERAARERAARVQQALAHLPALEAKQAEASKRRGRPPGPPRVSTTDPEARVMKMADGGFRPAYNLQFASVPGAQVIVGVEVRAEGSDRGQLPPMVKPLERRHQQTPAIALVDGGFTTFHDLTALCPRTTVYAPVPRPRNPSRDPYRPQRGDPPAVAAWRERMGTAAAQTLYKLRAATAECVNAHARARGLTHLAVRGVRKVLAIALWSALAHNVLRTLTLRPAPAPA